MKNFPFYICLYILTILVLNLGFSYVPMIDLGFGMFSPMAVLAGVVFVVRDFAQRQSGHWVLVGMAAGAGLSFLMADPFVAYASVAAFAASEVMDWLLYTVTKKPFHQRVLLSSLVSTPIDTAVFLTLINGMTVGTFVLMVAAKLVAAVVIWYTHREPSHYRTA
jgi:uncharacterized PurR-regulated membrane protein YhhQ (DUF165 family)